MKAAAIQALTEANGRLLAFGEVSEVLVRLARLQRAKGFDGSYLDALTDITDEMRKIVAQSKPPKRGSPP